MKKRNQLVSALLTGVLFGGAAAAGAGSSCSTVLAESLEENAANEAAEDTGGEAAPQESAPTPAPVQESTPAPSSGEGQGDTGSGESQTPSAGETGSDDTGSGGTNPESSGESTPDSGASETPSAEPGSTAPSTEDSSSVAEDPASSSEESVSTEPESGAESLASDAELTEEDKPVEETETTFEGGYIYTGGGYAYLDAHYTYRGMSNDQWKLYIKYGFRQVGKVYAVANVPEKLNIRDGKSLDAQIVGEMPPFGLCYILADPDDEWVYVESGGVRGFVFREYLITGKKAEQIVRKYGERTLPQAVQLVEPADNAAFRYSMNTVYDTTESEEEGVPGVLVDRAALTDYAREFVGLPYAWGGDSSEEGMDSASLVRRVYGHFGVDLPGTAYALAGVGTRIVAEDAMPGDLIYYEKDGIVYHVLLYLGDGKGLDAGAASGAVEVVDVDWRRVCWAGRLIGSDEAGGDEVVTEVSSLEMAPVAAAASDGSEAAASRIIDMLAQASEAEWEEYGFSRAVIIAQAILESNWCSFSTAAEQGIQPSDNNVLGMNADLLNDRWESPWAGTTAERMIPSENNGMIVWSRETMRTYPDIASCLKDYAAFKTGLHPELIGETDIDVIFEKGFPGYAQDSAYIKALRALIDEYDLSRFDEAASGRDVRPEETPADITGAESAGGGALPQTDDGTDEAANEGPEAAPGAGAETDSVLSDADALSGAETAPAAESDGAEDMPQDSGIEIGSTSFAPGSAAGTADAASAQETVTEKDAEDEKPVLEDNGDGTLTGRPDPTVYSQQEMELIWAVVAEEDDTSYDGALAVISCVMNRADENYSGFGKNALSQLQAEGQFCCSASVADPIYYQRRLEGNVPDYVKQAVYDCLTQGIRSHAYTEIGTEGEKQIGNRWYA